MQDFKVAIANCLKEKIEDFNVRRNISTYRSAT